MTEATPKRNNRSPSDCAKAGKDVMPAHPTTAAMVIFLRFFIGLPHSQLTIIAVQPAPVELHDSNAQIAQFDLCQI
jgi:hypothetical protein